MRFHGKIYFQSNELRLFSVDEFIVLLDENTARNPEFDYGRFELADINNPGCKANFILINSPFCSNGNSRSLDPAFLGNLKIAVVNFETNATRIFVVKNQNCML